MNPRRRVVLAKIESTYGTDSVPVPGTDAVLVRSVSAVPLEQEYAERELVRPFLGNFEDLPARSRVRLDIDLEMAGFGAAGPATPTPGYDALLRICGLSRTISLGVDVQYKPISIGFESCTIYFYQDGTLHKLTGCRGNLEIVMDLNQVPVYRLAITGLYIAPGDAALPTPTLSGYQRPLVVNRANTTAFNLHGFAGRLQTLNLNLNNQVVHRNLVGQGGDEIVITNREPAGNIEIEAPDTIAAKDWYTSVQSVTLSTLSVTHGPALNQVKIDAPNVQLTNPRFNEVDNKIHLAFDLQLMPGAAGNDELNITVK